MRPVNYYTGISEMIAQEYGYNGRLIAYELSIGTNFNNLE